MATATEPEITAAPTPALTLAPPRSADTPARPRPASTRPDPARATPSHDDNGDVVGLLAGTGILLTQAFAIIPGLLPILLLTGVFALPLVLPVVALGLVASVVIGVPVLLFRGVRRAIAAVRN